MDSHDIASDAAWRRRDIVETIKAIDTLVREAVEAERDACAKAAADACLVPPDGGCPTETERIMCERAAAAILARSVRQDFPVDDDPF